MSPCSSPAHSTNTADLLQLHQLHAAQPLEGSMLASPSHVAISQPYKRLLSRMLSNSQPASQHDAPTQLDMVSSPDSSPSSTALLLATDSSQSTSSPRESCPTHCGEAFSDSSNVDASHDATSPSSDVAAQLAQVRSPAVKAIGLQPMLKPPKGNAVKQYHKLSSMQGVVFYQQLKVTDEYGNQHCFDVHDNTKGALVRFAQPLAALQFIALLQSHS